MAGRNVRGVARLAAILSVAFGASLALAQDQTPGALPALPAPPATTQAAPSDAPAVVPPVTQAAPAAPPTVVTGPSVAAPPSRSAPVVNLAAQGGDIRAIGADVSISGTADSVAVAGANVSVTGSSLGDVYAAGAKVQIDETTMGRVHAAGASIEIKGRVDGGIDAAGATVTVDSVTIGDVRVAAASVTIGPTTDIQKKLQVVGGDADIAGHIGGSVGVAAANINFAARADGKVTLRGGHIVIGAGARIAGDLEVMSTEPPIIADGAVISGNRIIDRPPAWTAALSPWSASVVFAAAVALGTILAGIVLALFGGRLFVTAVNQVRMRPGTSLLIGLVTVIVVPIISAILIATVVGFSAGVAVMLVLPLLTVFGHAVAAAGVAGGIFVHTTGRIGIARALLLLVVGAILVALLALIPLVGPLLVAIVLLLGIGALTRTLGGRLRRTDVAVP